MDTEIWKDIIGYEGQYQVSNLGRIKSLYQNINGKLYHRILIIKTRISKRGYELVDLKRKTISVHRLVAQAFLSLDIKNKKIVVCHKNDIKLDNNVNNLFLGSQSDNILDSINKGRFKLNGLGKIGVLNKRSKKINQYDLEGNFITTWNSMMDIKRELGYSTGNISRCCKKQIKTYKSFIWKYF